MVGPSEHRPLSVGEVMTAGSIYRGHEDSRGSRSESTPIRLPREPSHTQHRHAAQLHQRPPTFETRPSGPAHCLVDYLVEGCSGAGDIGEDGLGDGCPHLRFRVVVVDGEVVLKLAIRSGTLAKMPLRRFLSVKSLSKAPPFFLSTTLFLNTALRIP